MSQGGRSPLFVLVAVASCAPAPPLVTAPAAPPPPVCPLEGCSHDAWADLEKPGTAACPASPESDCVGLTPSACTDEALASWGEGGAHEGKRSLGCIARTLAVACEQGESRACAFAGRLFLDGTGLQKDVDHGLALLTRACDDGVALACLVGARFLGEAHGGSDGSDAQHRFEMQHACLSGQGEACLQVGLLFRLGESGFPADLAKAVVAYTLGCNAGESRSCNNFGDALAYGEGVARDLEKAVVAFDKACHLGEALGCANLAFRFERGLGVPHDLTKARSLYRDACNVGSPYACLHLDLLAAQGNQPPRDTAAAAARWLRACKGGDAHACAFVGLIYDDGPDGLTRDEAKSQAAMSRACELGEPRACDWVRMHSGDDD
jgi:TPR repeat protein